MPYPATLWADLPLYQQKTQMCLQRAKLAGKLRIQTRNERMI